MPDRESRQHRRELRESGTRGPALRDAMSAWRDQRDAEAAPQIPESYRPYIQHPAKFLNNLMKNKHMGNRLAKLRQISSTLGYGTDQQRLQDAYAKSAAAAAGEDPTQAGSAVEVERDFGEAPTFSAFQQYLGHHIDPNTGEATGLTANEMNAYRARGLHTIADQTNAATTGITDRLSAAGIDPRSGIGSDQASKIAAAKENALLGLESGLTDADLARKQQFETMAQNQGRAEEQRRQYDVSGDLRRLADVEGGEYNLANLGENERQYDVGFGESRRQARMAREAAAKAAKDLEPSTLDKVGAGFQGFFGGLGMGGGGGGGGGGMMGGMMGG